MTRKLHLALAALAFATLLAPSVLAQSLTKTLFASGLNRPVWVGSPPGDFDRMFVVEQGNSSSRQARVRLIKNGVLQTQDFLNIDSLVANSGNERGFLGLAFHPQFASNREFFVNYTNTAGTTVIARYTASASNPDVANPVGQTILVIGQPFSNHNGGCIAFGPDGMLYIGTGDGGSANDPGNRAQNPNDLLGKMLRIDVDNVPSGATYGIPVGNPYATGGGRAEIWAIGLRNPWRFSFDRATGDMWIGDVGQNAREEIDFVAAGTSTIPAINFGWRCMEANACTGLSGCTCNSAPLTLPAHTYLQGANGFSITGGYRYRGCAIPSLQGKYLFADYVSNRVWSGDVQPSGNLTSVTRIDSQLGTGLSGISSFGEDAGGELYICSRSNGAIWKITPASTPNPLTIVGTPGPGTSFDINIAASAGQGLNYVLGLSAGTFPGIALGDGRTIPLNLDPLMSYFLFTTPNGVYDPYGTLSTPLGNASVTVTVPNDPSLAGVELWAGFIVTDAAAPSGIFAISCATKITL